jgi:hypothetical protein
MRFRDLPGGINRADYSWPMISCIHPEHGSYQMDVHCLRDPKTDVRVLMAFAGYAKPNSPERKRRVDLVADTAREMGDVIEPLEESDISQDIALRLAATLHDKPGTKVVLMQVARP